MPTTTVEPIYMQPAAWSAALALIAIVLSQLPPIRQILRGHKLDITTVEFCSLNHYLGNLQLVIFLGLRNRGGRTENIAQLNCAILGDNGARWVLPIQTYVLRQSVGQPSSTGSNVPTSFILGWTTLKPGESWGEMVTGWMPWTEAEAEQVDDISATLRREIQAQVPPSIVNEGSPSTVQRATLLFERKFGLGRGTYQLVIAALSEAAKPLAVIGFDFTMYESSIRDLKAIVDFYKYGQGVCFPVVDTAKGTTTIRLSKARQLTPSHAIALYKTRVTPNSRSN